MAPYVGAAKIRLADCHDLILKIQLLMVAATRQIQLHDLDEY